MWVSSQQSELSDEHGEHHDEGPAHEVLEDPGAVFPGSAGADAAG